MTIKTPNRKARVQSDNFQNMQRLSSVQIVDKHTQLSLPEFLDYCSKLNFGGTDCQTPASTLDALCHVFVGAGLRALENRENSSEWVQFGLKVRRGANRAPLYRTLSAIVRELLDDGSIRNFFFVHKPPGLRVRFEPKRKVAKELATELLALLEPEKASINVEQITPGVYEPEQYLFGGPHSIEYVHDLFTVDSLVWLEYYSRDRSEFPLPSWVLSISMLKELYSQLKINDLEDLDVWDRIRRTAGRRLSEDVLSTDAFIEFARGIRSFWGNGELLDDDVSNAMQEVVATFARDAAPITQSWLSEYFSSLQALIGPREAMAIFTLFHWNRAGLSATRQALLTEALIAWKR